MHADTDSESAQKAISLTDRGRKLEQDYHAKHGIVPQSIRKAVTDKLARLRPKETAPVPAHPTDSPPCSR
jgi:excinuclease UvrABC helicase subunit UvrB